MTTSRYDQIADWYDESIRSGSLIYDLFLPELLNMIGDIQGQHVCDLACGQVGAYHRTLSTYLNALAETSFLLERTVEPQATGQIAASIPGYTEVPVAFLGRCKRI